MDNKFEKFTDDEIYVLKRQAIESSANIMLSGRYEPDFRKAHGDMLNEITSEIKRRSTEECK